MKIKIKSTQIYEDNTEEIEEKYDNAELNIVDKKVMLKYNESEIIYDENNQSIIVNNKGNCIYVEIEKEKESNYETPYGNFNIKTYGKSINFTSNPFRLKVEYMISLNNSIKYNNIINITEN